MYLAEPTPGLSVKGIGNLSGRIAVVLIHLAGAFDILNWKWSWQNRSYIYNSLYGVSTV